MSGLRVGEAVPRILFFGSLLMLAFGYGVIAEHNRWFPVPIFYQAAAAAGQLLEESGAVLPWYYRQTQETEAVKIHNSAAVVPGLRLIGGLAPDETTVAKVIDSSGRLVHSWSINWFKLWPNPDHLSEDLRPKSNASLVHGMIVMPDGDLVFNFENLGLVRLDPCGGVRWRLPYRTHHSIFLDDQGHLWVPGIITRNEREADRPKYLPPFDDFRILEVSGDGQIMRELDVADLLTRNGLKGLLYMSSTHNRNMRVTGDTLHLNDVEVFPKSLSPGLFQPGDVMISLRNINAVLVFDPATLQIKFQSVGQVIRQHDPDFVDGNTISVFNNNNLATFPDGDDRPDPTGQHSQIVRLFASGRSEVVFEGSDPKPVFSDIMGSHQLLSNGNTLIVESIQGRVLEIDGEGKLVWEYLNLFGNGQVLAIDDGVLLPPQFNDTFFRHAVSECSASDQ